MTAGRKINTLSTDWCTPTKYVDLINIFFNGNINLDPCSNKESIVNAELEYIYPINNGLIDSWDYKNIFVNPPYGRDKENHTTIKNWIKRCWETNLINKSEVLALIPVATNTSHWKEYIFGQATGVCFLYDTRLKFRIENSEINKGCPMACCLVYWGDNYSHFVNIFHNSGHCVLL